MRSDGSLARLAHFGYQDFRCRLGGRGEAAGDISDCFAPDTVVGDNIAHLAQIAVDVAGQAQRTCHLPRSTLQQGHIHGVRHMDEAAPDVGVLPVDEVQQGVHQVVAHIGACSVGQGGGDACVLDVLHHGLHGQRSEIGGLAVLLDGHVDGLITGVVGDAAVHQVDGHLFRGDGGAAAGLTDADDHIGLVCLNGSFQHLTGTDELGGHFLLDDLGTGDGVGQQ